MAQQLKRPRLVKSTSTLDDFDLDSFVEDSGRLGTLPSRAGVPPASPALRPGEPAAAAKTALLVMKFSGSSLAGVEHLRRVAGIVRRALPLRPVLVLSAMGKTTDHLLDAAENAVTTGTADICKIRNAHDAIFSAIGVATPAGVEALLSELERILSGIGLLKEISGRTRDLVVSFGERLSVRVFEAFFNSQETASDTPAGNSDGGRVQARAFDSWEIGMQTTSGAGSFDSTFSQVEVLGSSYANIASHLTPLETNYSYVPVVTGYVAQDLQGTITTLGRNGSDLTATIIGAAVHASEVQIWKDFSGIQTMDPRLVPNSKPVGILTYEEAAELTVFGAKLVHPAAVMPAWLDKVPMSVRNSMEPEHPGTRIVAELGPGEARRGPVIAMSCKKGITMVVIRSTRMLGQHGFLAHVFQVFNKFEVSIDVISTSEITISLTLDRGFKSVDMSGILAELQAAAKVEVMEDMSMLTLITTKANSCHVLRQSFQAFEAMGTVVEMVSHGASNVNVTFVLPGPSLAACTKKLHEAFFGS